NTTTSFSPFSQASARFVRTGSVAVKIWPVVASTFDLGNRRGCCASALVPVFTAMVTSGLLRSSIVLNRPTLSLWIRARLPRCHNGGVGNATVVARGTVYVNDDTNTS